MAGVCDICGKSTGRRVFRCTDGKVCRDCYEIVSNHFTSTITKSTLAELKERYAENAAPLDLGENGFHISYKIGTFLLLDEQNQKFCILSNRAVTGVYARPEIFSYDALEEYEFLCEPEVTMEEFLTLTAKRRSKTVIKNLRIRLKTRDSKDRDLVLLPGAAKPSGPACRQAGKYAKEIVQWAKRLQDRYEGK